MLTPYQFASNRPIDGIDLDGLEFLKYNDSYVYMAVQYDSKQKRATGVGIFLRANDTKKGTFFSETILPGVLNDAVNQGGSSQVTNVQPIVSSPLVKNDDQMDMKDVVDKPSIAAPQEFGMPIIPQNKPQMIQQQRTKEFFTPGITGSLGKWDAGIAAIELAGTIGQQVGIGNANGILRTAQGKQNAMAVEVLGIIQGAINNNQIGEDFLNQASLTGIANYLLYGKQIEKYEVINGKGQYVVDNDLMGVAKGLWNEYESGRSRKELQKQLNDSKSKTDNTGVKNGGGF